MATISGLALRVLKKLQILPPGQDADAEDLETAIEKLRTVHASLKKEGLTQWTINDIPDYAEEPYVLMAAFLAGPEYERPVDVGMWQFGISEIRSAIQLPATGTVCADYF
jgi:hypothetical protein